MASACLPTTEAWCLFRSFQQPYAIPLECVSEVVSVESLVRLPLGPPELLGLCTIRRDVIPVVGLIDGRPAEAGAHQNPSAVLVIRAERETWGIGISREGIIVDDQQLGEDESAMAAGLGPRVQAESVRRGETSYTVIDPEALWRSVRGLVERWYGLISSRQTAPSSESLKSAPYTH
jgi:chemotaxis signal transduction protein